MEILAWTLISIFSALVVAWVAMAVHELEMTWECAAVLAIFALVCGTFWAIIYLTVYN